MLAVYPRNLVFARSRLHDFSSYLRNGPREQIASQAGCVLRFISSQNTTSKTKAKAKENTQIATLDPSKFTLVQQKAVNLETRSTVHVPKFVHLAYKLQGVGPPVFFFPPGSTGFLYYRKPQSDEPELSGSLRFRIVPSGDSSMFEQGKDLARHDGPPWSLSLYQLAQHAKYSPIVELLKTDGLISKDLVDQIRTLPAKHITCLSTVMYRLSEPFYSDLWAKPERLFFITPSVFFSFKFLIATQLKLKLNRCASRKDSWQGRIQFRFEKSPLPEHAKTCHVVLRILDIDGRDAFPKFQERAGRTKPLVVGELYQVKASHEAEYTPWTWDFAEHGVGDIDSLLADSLVQ